MYLGEAEWRSIWVVILWYEDVSHKAAQLVSQDVEDGHHQDGDDAQGREQGLPHRTGGEPPEG